MPLPRFILPPILSYLLICLLQPMIVRADENISLKRAATKSSINEILRFKQEKQHNTRNTAPVNNQGFSTTAPPGATAQGVRSTGLSPRTGAAFGLPNIRGLIKKVNESVVAIRMLDSDDSWSLSRIGLSKNTKSKPTGYGAGFIISRDGYIVTNEHVLRSGSKIEVELLDGSKHQAKAIEADKKNDLALIKIDCNKVLIPVTLGDSDKVELGEWVVGIGNPYGIGQSIMVGVVSAKSRMIPGSGYPPLIQIDATMNLGNSGGPLFNLNGEVIGVNTILLWKSQGIGFATPSKSTMKFIRMAQNSGAIRSASAPGVVGPRGPTANYPQPGAGVFNPLDPPWKSGN